MPPVEAASAVVAAWNVCELGECLLLALCPHLAGLCIHRVADTGEAVVVFASSRARSACCPRCGSRSWRVHGGYVRVLADVPAGGRPVQIVLAVRRFRCPRADCPAVTFAGQAEGVSARYRRRSLPLLGMLTAVALELAGRGTARLARALGIAVHRTTVLRLIMALPDPQVTAAPQVTGVDDFALRRGRVYGTVLVDVTTGTAIDLLPDRETGTLEAWLTAHPGAKVICRDRAGSYADAARAAAPQAIQVADRWHLWHNLAEYAEKTVTAHRSCLTGGPSQPAGAGPAAAPLPEPDGLKDVCGRERPLVARTRERHAAVHGLLAAGHSRREAARILGLSRNTVNRFAAAASPGQLLVKATSRESKLDPFKPYLHHRWNEGITDASALHAELKTRGFTGSDQAVRRYIRPFRQMAAAPPPPPAAPKTRQITRWLLTRPDRLSTHDQAQLAGIRARCPHLNTLATHVSAFAQMMICHDGQYLDQWLTDVDADDQPQLHSFANGIRRDHDAVRAGLTLPYSSGAVEGNVTKIKMIKRQMYGRAGFDLLRKRVIHHPA